MFEATEIKHMSQTERLQAMELLWDSLTLAPEQVESPAWHEAVLSDRLAKVEAGQGKFLTLSEVKERLNKKQR